MISPLFQPGYFWGAHDARHDVYFIFQYDQSVQEGIWSPDGGPTGRSATATRSGSSTRRWRRSRASYSTISSASDRRPASKPCWRYRCAVRAWRCTASCAHGWDAVPGWWPPSPYMAIPYHLVDLYVRAAMAESVALALLPLALWGFRETVSATPGRGHRRGLAYAAMMWTSNLVALIFTPGLAVVCWLLIWWQRADNARPTTSDQGPRSEKTARIPPPHPLTHPAP